MLSKVSLLILIIILISSIVVIGNTANEDFLVKIKGAGLKADGTPLKVGISASQLLSEMAIVMNVYPKWLLEQAGCDVYFVQCDFDLVKQINYFEDFITIGQDVIILHAVDQYGIASIVKKAQEAGIKVFANAESVTDKDGNYITELYCGSDNKALAREAAKYFIEKAAGRKVKIVQIIGAMGSLVAINRDEAFRETIKDYPNIELVDSKVADWLTEKAHAITVDMLTTTPDIWGIYSQSDCMLPGVFSALEQAGKLFPVGHEKHIITVSIDGAPYALEKIREGVHDMTVEQSPYGMACMMAKGALMVAKGVPLPESPNNIIELGPLIVTAENVDDPALWGNFGVPSDELWPGTQEIFDRYKWPGDEKIYE